MLYTIFFILAVCIVKGNANDCVPREFPYGFACVCNSTYCDEAPDPVIPDNESFYMYVTSKAGRRMSPSQGKMNNNNTENANKILVNSSQHYQKILGFGGAFTDSTGMNVKKLSPATQEQLLSQCFGQNGSRYSLGRVPIGGTDFSVRRYTYDDYPNDDLLKHFSLAQEDYDYKIPLMKRANELNPEMKYISAAWTAPPWMKTNDDYKGFGFLKKEFYQTYADYLVKFLDAYNRHGIKMWGMSTGNEPLNVLAYGFPINSMGWTPDTVATWVEENLGPTLENSQHNETKIFTLDDQRFELPWFVDRVMRHANVSKYLKGTAVHWYYDGFFSTRRLDETHNKHPELFLLMTEACSGSGLWEYPKVQLGSWDRGAKYAESVIEYLNHWSIGWIDWNLALDSTGGPTNINNNVDAALIVFPETDEFIKQPMFYALQHFSKFMPRGSTKIAVSEASNIPCTGVLTPNGEIVVVLYNKLKEIQYVTLEDVLSGRTISLTLEPSSITTVIYNQ